MKNPIIFIQPIDLYKADVLIVCDASQEGTVKWLKKQKVRKNLIDWIKTDKEMFEILEKNEAVFYWNEKVKGNMILLKNYEDRWEFWEALTHEIHHLVFKMSKEKMMSEEMEAQAYLFEFLFHSIRRKLQKIDKI